MNGDHFMSGHFSLEKRIYEITTLAGVVVCIILIVIDLSLYHVDTATVIECLCMVTFMLLYLSHEKFVAMRQTLYTSLAWILLFLTAVIYIFTGALGTIQAMIIFIFSVLGQFLISKKYQFAYLLVSIVLLSFLLLIDEVFPALKGNVDKIYLSQFYTKRKVTFYVIFLPVSYMFYKIKAELNFYRDTVHENLIIIKEINDKLIASNILIEEQKNNLEKLNSKLEDQIKSRTNELINQNKKLMKYAYYNAHVFRAPICRIKGLLQIMTLENISEEEKNNCWQYLLMTSEELNRVSAEVSKLLDKNYKITFEELKEIEFQIMSS